MPPVLKAGCIVRDTRGRYLLIEHQHTPFWEFPKGHLEPGESPADAAVREVYEETGYRVGNLRPAGTLRYTSAEENAVEVALFRADVEGYDDTYQTDETWAWKAPREARGLLFENLRPYLP